MIRGFLIAASTLAPAILSQSDAFTHMADKVGTSHGKINESSWSELGGAKLFNDAFSGNRLLSWAEDKAMILLASEVGRNADLDWTQEENEEEHFDRLR